MIKDSKVGLINSAVIHVILWKMLQCFCQKPVTSY